MTWSAEIQRQASTEITLATVRAALAAVGVVTVQFHLHPGIIADAVLVSYLVYSVAVLLVLRRRPALAPRAGTCLHVLDLAAIFPATLVTGGAGSPLFAFLLYALLAAGYRWGFLATVATALAGVAMITAQTLIASWGLLIEPVELDFTVARAAILVVGGLLVGYFAESERTLRRRTWAATRILAEVKVGAGLIGSVAAVLNELLTELRASHAILVLQEQGLDRPQVWECVPRPGRGDAAIRYLKQGDWPPGGCLLDVPGDIGAWTARAPAPDTASAVRVTTMSVAGDRSTQLLDLSALTALPFPWHSVLCVPTLAGDGWNGRLFIFDASAGGRDIDRMLFAHAVAHQAAPALFNVYLQRRLKSRASVVDRARIARELHDRVIQSLIGTQLQVEALRLREADRLPAPVAEELASVVGALGAQTHEVRDLMQHLRPADLDPRQLVGHLAAVVGRFHDRTGIAAVFETDVETVSLPGRVCREISGIVHEALTNVRKHADASRVSVGFGRRDGAWFLTVEDNGRGFPFDGRKTIDELARERLGPETLRERVAALQGTLVVDSRPGEGARLDITIPGSHHG